MKPRFRSYDPFASLQTLSPAVPPTMAEGTVRAPLSGPDERSQLERLEPSMARAICLLWGHPEMNAYFDKLWLADNSRTPIHPGVMSELMLLSHVHQRVMPQRPKRGLASIYGTDYALPGAKVDPWSHTVHNSRRG